jgi:hypothetical protein
MKIIKECKFTIEINGDELLTLKNAIEAIIVCKEDDCLVNRVIDSYFDGDDVQELKKMLESFND